MYKSRRSVDIYQDGVFLKLVGLSTTKDHYVIPELPPDELSIDSSAAIGKAVIIAMNKCRLGIDAPRMNGDVFAMELGFKNWKDMVKKSRYCQVVESHDNEQVFEIAICKKSGAYGFDLTGENFFIDKENVQAIGEKVRLALERFQKK